MAETVSSLKTLFEIIFIYALPILVLVYVILSWTGYIQKLGNWVFENVTTITNAINNMLIGFKNFSIWSCKLTVKIVSTIILAIYIVLIVLYFVYL